MAPRARGKMNIPSWTACVLLCLTLLSFHLCSGLYARYIAKEGGADTARVAAFNITQNHTRFFDTFEMDTAPGIIYRDILVNNDSEVAVDYTITIRNTTGNIPYKFRVGEGTATLGECTATHRLAPNSAQTIRIYAIWDYEGALEYMGMIDNVKISIVAAQAD